MACLIAVNSSSFSGRLTFHRRIQCTCHRWLRVRASASARGDGFSFGLSFCEYGIRSAAADSEPIQAEGRLVEHGLIMRFAGRLPGRPDREFFGERRMRSVRSPPRFEIGQGRDRK